MTERTEARTRTSRKKKKNTVNGKLLLLGLLVLVLLVGGIFACNAIFSKKPLPIVYQKDNALMVSLGNKTPFVISENYAGGATGLIENGKGLLYTDTSGALCYSSITSANAAKKTTILADSVFSFTVADDSHIYYIKNGTLFAHDLKAEKELAAGVEQVVSTEDGRFVFFNTATDLFGINVEKDSAPVRIATDATVFDLLYTAVDWTIDSKQLYYLTSGKFARINEDLTETVLCENAAIGFVLDGAVFAVTETQIDVDAYKRALVRFDGTEPTQLASDILGTEAVSQLYPGKKYMLFTKLTEGKTDCESYYTLDAKGNFRYLCDNEEFTNIFTDDSGKALFVHTKDNALYEYKLTGKAERKEDSKKLVCENITRAYAVGDHVGVAADLSFGIYHNDEFESVYDNGQPHYPLLTVEDGKAYICDQAGNAPFYICRNGKLHETDAAVVHYKLIAGNRVAYLKNNDTFGENWDLYKIDGNQKPVLIDTGVTALF